MIMRRQRTDDLSASVGNRVGMTRVCLRYVRYSVQIEKIKTLTSSSFGLERFLTLFGLGYAGLWIVKDLMIS